MTAYRSNAASRESANSSYVTAPPGLLTLLTHAGGRNVAAVLASRSVDVRPLPARRAATTLSDF
jgi:hypothetical protein